jgi:hypothetical protein
VRQRVGSLPPNLVFFSVSLFSSSCRLFPGVPQTYAHHKVKKRVKTKLKCVIPTFFTCFAQILTARTERIFLLGWSDPRFTLGTEPCAKVGSLQPNSVPLRVHPAILSRATSSPFGISSVATVNAKVTDRVICVFYPAVTFQRCK